MKLKWKNEQRRLIDQELEKAKECLGELNGTDVTQIAEQLSEVAAEHVNSHDIILMFGRTELIRRFILEIKDINCSIIYIESSISGI